MGLATICEAGADMFFSATWTEVPPFQALFKIRRLKGNVSLSDRVVGTAHDLMCYAGGPMLIGL